MMIDVYSWGTPNGHKVHIMLEECELAYALYPVDISVGEQFSEAFSVLNPNHKIPVIVDHEGPDGEPITVFESGAILIYLAEKTGKFLPKGSGRYDVLQWLMFQMGSVGPMFGQAGHFIRFAPEKVPYGIKRYSEEVQRLCQVMNTHLMARPYMAGGQYTIADIAIFPWVRSLELIGISLENYPYLKDWFNSIEIRPAVQKGLQCFD